MKDFRKFATSKMGINGMVLDDIVSMQNQYMNPYILEERQLNVTQMDAINISTQTLLSHGLGLMGSSGVASWGISKYPTLL